MWRQSVMSAVERLIAAGQSSQMLRVFLVGALTLVLLLPIARIGGLVSERQERHQTAVVEVSDKWGNTQSVTGPALVLPYTTLDEQPESDQTPAVDRTRYAVFLPAELRVTGQINTESRERGLFSVPVYTMSSSVSGKFEIPNLDELGINPATVDWGLASFVVGISDVRAIVDQSMLSWSDSEVEFLPGTTGFNGSPGIHALVPVSDVSDDLTFSFLLSLNGSHAVYWVPFAEETSIQLASNSRYPSFQGNWLPTERTISANGFDALWRVSYLGRDYPQSWTSGTDVGQAIEASLFGVELSNPVDLYRMAERSVKYAGLFVLLTFAVVWLTEVLARTRVHPIQYLMLGAAICVFYLLELALAEHIGFHPAYAIASLSVIGMVASYGRTIFGSWRRAAWGASSIAFLYAYLFVLLTNEESALLFGSIGLFAALATIMFVTRRINWYAGANSPGDEAESELGSA